MATIAVSWIPIVFDTHAPEWILRNHLRHIFNTNPAGIQRVFIDPMREGVVGVVWSSDVSTLPASHLEGLRSWTYADITRPVNQNNENENENNNDWNYSERRNIPRNSHNAITMDEIRDGDLMVNFHDRFQYGDYFKKTTYDALPRTAATNFKKLNPMTREPIDEDYVRPYTARIVGGGKRKRTMRIRKRNRNRTSRRRS